MASGAESWGDVVDYGCGDKPYLELFASRCSSYLGVDAGGTAADLPLNEDGTLPLPSDSADLVISTQVLEHVADPALYLAEAARVLRRDGKLILSTHGIWAYHPHPTDFWRWTSDGLARVVEQAGFGIVSFRGILGPPATGLQLWQDAVRAGLPGPLRPPFTFVAQFFVGLQDSITRQATRDRDASIFLVVAAKRR